MKTVYTLLTCLLLVARAGLVSAQGSPDFTKTEPEKTKIFNRIPEKFSVDIAALENLFSLKVNAKVVLPFGGSNFFEGTVTEKVQHNEKVTSINIASSNFDKALFTLSKISQPGRPVTYTGRMLSMDHGDVLNMTMRGSQMMFSKQTRSITVAE